MRQTWNKTTNLDSRITYRGIEPSRLDTLTDTVFGIAITLLIFNIDNPNSFQDILTFTKTLPAFMISIVFLFLLWLEHNSFSLMYTVSGFWQITINVFLLALIIFFVYPLRFLMLVNSNMFLRTNINVEIESQDIGNLMIYYGLMAFAVYLLYFLLQYLALKEKNRLQLNDFEIFHNKQHLLRLFIMLFVPLLSVLVASIISPDKPAMRAGLSGLIYMLYGPLIFWWSWQYNRKQKAFSK